MKEGYEKQVQVLEQQFQDKQEEIRSLTEKHREELADKIKEIDRTKQMLAQLKLSMVSIITKPGTVSARFENRVQVEAAPGTASAVRRTSRSASCESFFFRRRLNVLSQKVSPAESSQPASAIASNLEEDSGKLSKPKSPSEKVAEYTVKK